ncbi:MAG TPA: hypothetical protein DC039_01215 [Leclercia adecarboxylata]|nr:hypothetical protein C3F35_09295 [Leclercia sp. LSNIH3]POW69993.1 hypothetical protein C3373_16905 [Leclercia sp. LSNIH4]QBF89224.1 hypothetical protein EXN74_00660 [Leclercia adecarboxylata]RFS77060.1 hypothetical protein D0U00_21055 [Leclercia adecarboxylata]HAF52587.1 hypothetical protein [Leclercia adecarboxylata]
MSLNRGSGSAMSKVWFTFGLMPGRYHTARIVTNGTAKTLYCAPTYLFLLTGGDMDPDPTPLPRGRTLSFR